MDTYDPCPRCGARVLPSAYGPCDACVQAMALRPRFARDRVWHTVLRWVGR